MNKIARGRSSEVYFLDNKRVIKLFFEGYPAEDACKEMHNIKIANELGCTELNAVEWIQSDGRNGIITNYIEGTIQNDMPNTKPLYILKAGKDLAKCHYGIHGKTTNQLDDVRKCAIFLLDSEPLSILTIEEKEKARNYILSLPEDNHVLHMDFHTGNVIVKPDGSCAVIDWMTACRGSVAAELAMMEFFFNDAELFPGSSPTKLLFYNLVRHFIGNCFFRAYRRLDPVDKDEIDRYRIIALILRRSWNIDFEKKTIQRKLKELIKRYCD